MRNALCCTALSVACIVLTACSAVQPATTVPHGGSFAGIVHGGQQPVSGAYVQLYAVGTGGDGSAALPLLPLPQQPNTVATDAGGNFSISSDYTCPNSDPEVYLTATGGNPGISSGTNNTALAMMAALGPCDNLGPGTFIEVNELTTVGSIAALYPFATSYAAIGSASSDSNQLSSDFTLVTEYTNTATGTVPGPNLPANEYASSVEIDTLADILATCVNSSGGVANDGSACGKLFAASKPPSGTAPTDTIAAIVDVLHNPTSNVATLFDLTPSTGAPFQPTLSSPPSDWTLPILPIPAAPTFSEAGGVYTGTQTVSLSESTSSATVYYTLDSSTPTTSSTVYSGPITISSPQVVKAFASVEGRTSSSVVSQDFLVAPAGTPPAETSSTPSASGYPNSVLAYGNLDFVSVQGTGQIFTYNNSSGYQLQVGQPYATPCADPSGMVIATISGSNVMAVVCYDTGQLLTLKVNSDGSLSPLGSVSGLASPFPGIVLVGTDVYIPLFGTSGSANGGVAQVTLAAPSTPVIKGSVTLVSPNAGQYANAGFLAESNGYLYVAAGSESTPQNTSSSIQVVQESNMSLVGSPFVVAHSPQRLTISNGVLYVTLYDATSLQSISISNPNALSTLEILSTCASIPVRISGTTAYVGCYAANTVEKVNIADPTNMQVTSTLSGITTPQDMAVDGTYLLIVSGSQGGSVYQVNTTTAF